MEVFNPEKAFSQQSAESVINSRTVLDASLERGRRPRVEWQPYIGLPQKNYEEAGLSEDVSQPSISLTVLTFNPSQTISPPFINKQERVYFYK